MKKLEDFKNEKVDLKHFSGNGNFVHTGYRFFRDYVTDVYYDEDGSGTINNDNERKSFSLTVAHPSGG